MPGATTIAVEEDSLATPERLAAIELGSMARRFLEAIVSTKASPADISNVVEHLQELTEVLDQDPGEKPAVHAIDNMSVGVRMFNPAVGQANPVAPPVHLYVSPIGSELGWLEFGKVHEGVPGYAHGGMIAMVLDQIMTRANGVAGCAGVTLNMQVEYNSVVPIGERLVVNAEVREQQGRKVWTRAWIARATNPEAHLATSTGLFLQLPEGKLMELFNQRESAAAI